MPSEFRSVSAGDPDPAVNAEATDDIGEELSSTLGAIEQDEFDIWTVERHDEAGHSPAAAEIAPALARCRIGSVAVGPGMPNVCLELAGSKETTSLTAREYFEKPFVVGVHGRDAP